MRTLHSFPILASLKALPKDMSRTLPTELTRRLRTENSPWHTAKTTTDKTESTTIKAIITATITTTTGAKTTTVKDETVIEIVIATNTGTKTTTDVITTAIEKETTEVPEIK